MTASGLGVPGSIDVDFDGTYTCTPAAVGFADPSTASSMSQAIFEQQFPLITGDHNAFPLSVQASVVDTATSPPTTAKGRYMIGAAAQSVAIARAVVLFIQANAVANVTTQQLGAVPTAYSTPGTPIDAPASPVLVPIK